MFYNSKEEQRYGRNKDTTINHAYISSGEYRKKFDQISDNKKLNKLLYQLAKTMLEHRSGTLYEDMYWIEAETATVVAKETEGCVESTIIYSKSTMKKICNKQGLITIHTYPSSSPPSISDLRSNYIYKYSLGIVCGHNGNVYIYTANEEVPKIRYKSLGDKFLNMFKSREKAQVFMLDELQKQFDVMIKEVQ